MTVIIGIDPSLRATGVCVLRPLFGSTYAFALKTFRSTSTGKSLYSRATRIDMLVDAICSYLDEVSDDDIVAIAIESPSYGSRAIGGLVYERAALFIALAIRLRHRARLIEIAPTQRAKYATGKGNADKMSVVRHTLAEHTLSTTSDDEIDAFVLTKIVARMLDMAIDQTTEYREEIAARVAAGN